MERACKPCLDLITQKETYSTQLDILKRNPLNEYQQLLPWYVGNFEPKTSIINFEAAKQFF